MKRGLLVLLKPMYVRISIQHQHDFQMSSIQFLLCKIKSVVNVYISTCCSKTLITAIRVRFVYCICCQKDRESETDCNICFLQFCPFMAVHIHSDSSLSVFYRKHDNDGPPRFLHIKSDNKIQLTDLGTKIQYRKYKYKYFPGYCCL